MQAMKQMMRHPSRALEEISDDLISGGKRVAERPMSAGGIVLLVLAILGFVWIFPELRRYLRIERM